PETLSARLSESLKRLRTEYADLYYLHNLGQPDRLDKDMKATAERLKKEKKIRFFGFSSHHANMVETLERAAEVGFVDVIMFKYNFRSYEDAALNRAMDKCAKAGIGLVAMKTQGGAVDSFQDRVDPFKEKGFNQHQATLKAVWADNRIHTIVSAMKNVQQVEENAEAARKKQMGAVERELLEQYAAATGHLYCRGCAMNCEPCVDAPVKVADTLRYRMYHEYYGDHEEAVRLFRELPPESRRITNVDFSAAEAACPYDVPIGELMRDAAAKLA
ncbi:MAG: aldo/keto reductase, partial [bacterium]|nr:aldo/keto reductase [bacterium]